MNSPIEKIKQMVDKLGSQKEVAKVLNISEPYLSDILKGKRSISKRIADALGFELRWVDLNEVEIPMVNIPIIGTISEKGIKINDTERITT